MTWGGWMKTKTEPQGIGGWLALFILGLIVLSPIAALNSYNSGVGSATERYPQLQNNAQWIAFASGAWWIMAVASVIKVLAGIKLIVDKRKSSVMLAVAALWVSGLGAVIAQYVLITSVYPKESGDIIDEQAGAAIATVITAGIWTAYLLKSKRVKNTYPG